VDLKPTDKTPNQHFEDGYESATLTIADHGVLFAKNYLAGKVAWAKQHGWSTPAHDAYWSGYAKAVEDRETP